MRKPYRNWLPILLVCLATVTASAQSFRVQCPNTTITHPSALNNNNAEPAYNGPTTFTADVAGQYLKPSGNVNGAIKCQQISGGDGYATMGDGTQTYMFSFGPLSGLADLANGLPATQFPAVFNTPYSGTFVPGDPATTIDGGGTFNFNGAVGLVNNVAFVDTIFDISESGSTVTVVLNAQSGFKVGDHVVISGTGAASAGGYDGTFTVTAINIPNAFFSSNFAFQFTDNAITNGPDINAST